MTSLLRRGALAVLLFALTATGVVLADATGPCKIATKGDTPTAKACATGGREAARKVMKSMVEKAKAKGVKFSCDNCHKDLENFELTKNATADYKKLEAASGM